MSTSDRAGKVNGATSDDCVRLWRTLTQEYIPGLRINLVMLDFVDGASGVKLELLDGPHADTNGDKHENVWASRSFFNPIYLISAASLFDLLITGYRTIDDFFREGESYAPARRQV